MAETVTNLTATKDGCIDPGYDVSADHVTGSDDIFDGQKSPVISRRRESSGSASVSTCSSHETVVSVGVRQPEPRDHPRGSPTEYDQNPEPETVFYNGDPPTEGGDEVFSSEMTVMSPLVNRWRRRQQAETGNNSISGPYLSWANRSGLRADPAANSDCRRGRCGHGYSSDTDAFLSTLNRPTTTSGQSVTVSGRCTGLSWQRDCTKNVHSAASSMSAVKHLEVYIRSRSSCRQMLKISSVG